MNDKDKEAFEKWLEIEFGQEVDKARAYIYEKSIFRFACEYMRNKSNPLDALSLYEKLERERAENKKLREALEFIASHDPEPFVCESYNELKDEAREALKEATTN